MSALRSFAKVEHELLPGYRARLNNAESTEDIKKFFFVTVQNLLDTVLEEKVALRYADFHLDPEAEESFFLGRRIRESPGFASAWEDSDLCPIIKRLAERAVNRHKRMAKCRDKTESKLFATPGMK